MFTVYLITNIINNKKYIGQTNDLDKRWYNHKWHGQKGHGSCGRLYASMKKHGIENFTIEVLEENIKTLIEAKEKEIYYIAKLDTQNAGYNATPGGTGGDMSQYTSWKIAIKNYHEKRIKSSYASNGMKNKKHSSESIIKQSTARKKYWDSMTLEERENRGQKISGSNNGMFGKKPKNSVQLEYLGIRYESIADAVKQTGRSAAFLKKHGVVNKYEQ